MDVLIETVSHHCADMRADVTAYREGAHPEIIGSYEEGNVVDWMMKGPRGPQRVIMVVFFCPLCGVNLPTNVDDLEPLAGTDDPPC